MFNLNYSHHRFYNFKTIAAFDCFLQWLTIYKGPMLNYNYSCYSIFLNLHKATCYEATSSTLLFKIALKFN